MNGNISNVKYKQGYTLLELIVVLALLAILLSIAIPNVKVIGKFEEKNELKVFRRDIVSLRNKAIIEGITYSLHIEKETNCYTIRTDYTDKKGGNLIKTVELVHWEIFGKNNFNSNIRFYRTGSPDSGGTMKLKNKKGKVTRLTISPVTGKLNIYND